MIALPRWFPTGSPSDRGAKPQSTLGPALSANGHGGPRRDEDPNVFRRETWFLAGRVLWRLALVAVIGAQAYYLREAVLSINTAFVLRR